jgi:hypothetical protein
VHACAPLCAHSTTTTSNDLGPHAHDQRVTRVGFLHQPRSRPSLSHLSISLISLSRSLARSLSFPRSLRRRYWEVAFCAITSTLWTKESSDFIERCSCSTIAAARMRAMIFLTCSCRHHTTHTHNDRKHHHTNIDRKHHHTNIDQTLSYIRPSSHTCVCYVLMPDQVHVQAHICTICSHTHTLTNNYYSYYYYYYNIYIYIYIYLIIYIYIYLI